MEDFAKMTKQQQLDTVNKAIYAVLMGGQSYTIGSRSLTRADLSLLKSMREELEAEITADNSTTLLDNTFVAFFSGR